MTVNPKGTLPIPPRAKLRRNCFVLILLGLGVYLFFPEVARIEHAFQVASTLKIPLVALSMGAQVLSYLGSGYLLRAVVELAAKPISVVDGALLRAGANSIGTLGGGILGAAGMTYLRLRRRESRCGGSGGLASDFLEQCHARCRAARGTCRLAVVNEAVGCARCGPVLRNSHPRGRRGTPAVVSGLSRETHADSDGNHRLHREASPQGPRPSGERSCCWPPTRRMGCPVAGWLARSSLGRAAQHRLRYVVIGVSLLGRWPWREHRGSSGRLWSPITFGESVPLFWAVSGL